MTTFVAPTSYKFPCATTVNRPPLIFCCDIGATEPPDVIHSSSPFPVGGAVIDGGFTTGAFGAVIFGDTGVKFIACGKLGCVALSGATVGAVNTLGLIPAFTSKATIGSCTALILAIP